MEGTTYYSNDACKVSSDADAETVDVELGRSGVLGDGPQVYIRIGDQNVFIPRASTSEFFNKLRALGDYLGR